MALWSRIAKVASAAIALRPEERHFAILSWFGAPLVELSLGLGGLERTLRWVEASSPMGRRRVSAASVSIEQGAWLVQQVYRIHVLRGACLPQSLLQYWLHRRAGTPARFVVGVRRSLRDSGPSAFEAHAWVESPDSKDNEPWSADPAFERLLVHEARLAG